MKIRNLLFAFILAMMVLCVGNFRANTVQASACTDFCYDEYRNCMIDCNGSPLCQQFCRDELYCCIEMCNTGSCDEVNELHP
jgi:hypothetical protein